MEIKITRLKMKQDKYTKSAHGKACTVRIPGVCRIAPDNETTVLAHVNGYGMAGKHLNIHGAYACAECHAWLDGGYANHVDSFQNNTREKRDLYHLQAVIRTQIIMVEEGVLKL